MTHQAWSYFATEIGKSSLKELTSNPVFMQTMFCESFVDTELEYLKEKYPEQDIDNLTREYVSTMGTGNNIHQLYHLTRFLEYAGPNSVYDANILEFGGGYGSFCARLKNLYNVNSYNIIDLPELQRVQKDYLYLNGLECNHFNSISDYLKKNGKGGTFIALWSLSETPQNIRDEVLNSTKFDYYLFAYGESFFDMKNFEYFEEFQKKHNHVEWKKVKIEFMQNQYYLYGKS
jgi:hypothetical protein